MSHRVINGCVVLDGEVLLDSARRATLSELVRQQMDMEKIDDFIGEIVLAVYENCQKYDPKKASLNTYVSHLINSRLRNLIRDSGLESRLVHHCLEDVFETVTVGDSTDQANLALDVRAVIRDLPPDLKRFTSLLQTKSRLEILAMPGMNGRHYYRQIHRLQAIFAAKGFDHLRVEQLQRAA